MTPGSQFPPVNLATLHAEIDLPVEKPMPWMVRNHDLVAMVLCLCIAAVTAYAIGRL